MDYKDCKCRKKLVDKLTDECTETIEEVMLAKTNLAENENNYKYSSCTVHIVLMIVIFRNPLHFSFRWFRWKQRNFKEIWRILGGH